MMKKFTAFLGLLFAVILMATACSGAKPQAANSFASPGAAASSPTNRPELTASASPSSPPKADPTAVSSPAPSIAVSQGTPQTANTEVAKTPSPAATAKPEDKPPAKPLASQAPATQSPATQSPAAQSPAVSKPPADNASAQAETLFKDNCMSCHAANLQGGFGPNLQHVGSRKTKEQIMNQIRGGGGDMPSFGGKLSNAQVDILAGWLFGKK